MTASEDVRQDSSVCQDGQLTGYGCRRRPISSTLCGGRWGHQKNVEIVGITRQRVRMGTSAVATANTWGPDRVGRVDRKRASIRNGRKEGCLAYRRRHGCERLVTLVMMATTEQSLSHEFCNLSLFHSGPTDRWRICLLARVASIRAHIPGTATGANSLPSRLSSPCNLQHRQSRRR